MTTAGQEASLFPNPPIYGSRKSSSICTALASSLPFPVTFLPRPPTAMAAAAAAAGPGAPLSPDELIPKGEAEKTEEELEEEDDEEVLGLFGARRGGERRSGRERPARGCGLRVLRDPGEGASRSLEGSERRCLLREAGLGAPLARSSWGAVRVPASGGGCRCFSQDPRLLHHS